MQEKELIDNTDLANLKPDLTYIHGKAFPSNGRFMSGVFGLVFLAGLLFSLINLNLIGIIIFSILLIPILYIVFSKFGVDISTKENYYKEFVDFFGYKRGEWKNAYGLTDVCILTLNKSRTLGGSTTVLGAMLPSVDYSEKETGVYLLTPTHRKRRLISICKSYKEAENIAKELSEKMQKKYTKFNPQISESTLRRRR